LVADALRFAVNRLNFENAMSQINFLCQGQGPPVILLHGMYASMHDWDTLLPILADSGYQVFAPDLPGHGESAWLDNPQAYRVENIAAELSAWIESLHLPEPPRLVGHSLGGYISLQYTICHPQQVARLVLVDPLYNAGQLSPLLLPLVWQPRLAGQAVRRIPPDWVYTFMGWDVTPRTNRAPALRQQIASDFKRTDPDVIHLLADIPDLTPHVSSLAVPTLVIWGESDPTLHPGSFPTLAQAIPGAHRHPIAGCGHQPHIDLPERTNRLVVEFFST